MWRYRMTALKPKAGREQRANFHQFSPAFTSSWAAVEVNAVQTKCEFYWGAIADSKGRHDR
jgi:hypothetical protein